MLTYLLQFLAGMVVGLLIYVVIPEWRDRRRG